MLASLGSVELASRKLSLPVSLTVLSSHDQQPRRVYSAATLWQFPEECRADSLCLLLYSACLLCLLAD